MQITTTSRHHAATEITKFALVYHFQLFFDNVNNLGVFILTRICWERKWQAEYPNTCTLWVLPYVYFLPPDGTCVAVAFPSQNNGTMNIEPQPDPTETKFWMTEKTPILWLFVLHWGSLSMTETKTERQERKEWKRLEGKRDAKAISRDEHYIWHMWREPLWIHRNL